MRACVFPGLAHDSMALKLVGKDGRTRRADFLRMAATAGIAAHDANAVMDELTACFAVELDQIVLPEVSNFDAKLTAKAEQMLALCHERVVSWH